MAVEIKGNDKPRTRKWKKIVRSMSLGKRDYQGAVKYSNQKQPQQQPQQLRDPAMYRNVSGANFNNNCNI